MSERWVLRGIVVLLALLLLTQVVPGPFKRDCFLQPVGNGLPGATLECDARWWPF